MLPRHENVSSGKKMHQFLFFFLGVGEGDKGEGMIQCINKIYLTRGNVGLL